MPFYFSFRQIHSCMLPHHLVPLHLEAQLLQLVHRDSEEATESIVGA